LKPLLLSIGITLHLTTCQANRPRKEAAGINCLRTQPRHTLKQSHASTNTLSLGPDGLCIARVH